MTRIIYFDKTPLTKKQKDARGKWWITEDDGITYWFKDEDDVWHWVQKHHPEVLQYKFNFGTKH